MKNQFSAYFQFKISSQNPRFLDLVRKNGQYSELENVKKSIVKIRFTYAAKLFMHVQRTGLKYARLRIINNVNQHKEGIAYFDCFNASVIVIMFPKTVMLEMFISEGNKGNAMFLYQKYLSGDLDGEINNLRLNAQDVACQENINPNNYLNQ